MQRASENDKGQAANKLAATITDAKNSKTEHRWNEHMHAFIRYIHYTDYNGQMPVGNRPTPTELNTGKFESVKNVPQKIFNNLGSELRGSNSSQKQIVYYIQTGVQISDFREKNTLTIKFRAPVDTSSDENASKDINYEDFKIEDEYKLLKERLFERYCHVQCLKICYYLQKVR